jgi:hypothetical protein
MPELGQCCDFATVRLPGSGVGLSAGVQYWLVASPALDAEDFMGIWRISTETIFAKNNPEQTGWTGENGGWAAAQITGQLQK